MGLFSPVRPQTITLGLAYNTRAAIEDEIERLIALLDTFDGDTDLEAEHDVDDAHDDGCGSFYAQGRRLWGSPHEEDGRLKPAYGVDQSAGPINYRESDQEHRAADLGLVRSPTGGWRWPN